MGGAAKAAGTMGNIKGPTSPGCDMNAAGPGKGTGEKAPSDELKGFNMAATMGDSCGCGLDVIGMAPEAPAATAAATAAAAALGLCTAPG